MAQVQLYCEVCKVHFEPIHEREQCPRCERDAAIARAEKLEHQMDELQATLNAMNEVALRPSGAIEDLLDLGKG